MVPAALVRKYAIYEKEDGVQTDDNPHGKVGCVKNAVTELRFAEQSSFSAPVAQDGFCDAENDDEADDKGDCGVVHAPCLPFN